MLDLKSPLVTFPFGEKGCPISVWFTLAYPLRTLCMEELVFLHTYPFHACRGFWSVKSYTSNSAAFFELKNQDTKIRRLACWTQHWVVTDKHKRLNCRLGYDSFICDFSESGTKCLCFNKKMLARPGSSSINRKGGGVWEDGRCGERETDRERAAGV